MRDLRAGDAWRVALRRNYQFTLSKVEYASLTGFGDGQIDFLTAGVTAIIGGNGVGKSTLIAAIGALVTDFAGYVINDYVGRLGGARVTGTFSTFTGTKIVEATIDDERKISRGGSALDGPAFWVAPSNFAAAIRSIIGADANFNDLIEAITPSLASDSERLELAYLIGKSYEKCEFFEISEVGNLEVLPYFRVTSQGVEYGSERMGLGELSAFLMYWHLRKADKNSLLILEEPETHLSPRSQRHLMNYVAKRCAESGLAVLMTTHSPEIVAPIPQKNLILVGRVGAGLAIHQNPSKRQVLELLGVVTNRMGAFLVEDRVAKLMVIELFRYFNTDLASEFEVIFVGGSGNIELAISSMPKTGPWFQLLGIFDGDERNHGLGKNAKWPFCFLPTDTPPDQYVLALLPHDLDRIAKTLNRSPSQVAGALESIKGLDGHEALTVFAKSVEVDLNVLIRAAIELGFSVEKSREAGKAFVDEVQKLLRESQSA